MNNLVKIPKNKEQCISTSVECFETMTYYKRFMVIHEISSPALREQIRLKLKVTPQYYNIILSGIGNNKKPLSEKVMQKHFLVAKECFKEFYTKNETVINYLTT